MQTLPFYASIGQRIQAFRKKKGLTQKQLADATKLSRTSITNIEKGRQKILVHTLFELASALAIEVPTLFPEKENPKGLSMTSEKIKKLPKEEKNWVMKIKSREVI
ncbi:MAG: helix-turn-helix transcriptional regulator [Candidatus Omnitrophica bacterium]|nr:helix-turn-helix transcriptional regulator [Candidatus Omnitrophota bacterium]